MNLIIRPAKSEDAQICGAICYNAFKVIAEAHHFPPDFPDTEMAVGLMGYAFSSVGVYAVVAEENGQIVGSNILWENGFIGGVGPITVDLYFFLTIFHYYEMAHLVQSRFDKISRVFAACSRHCKPLCDRL